MVSLTVASLGLHALAGILNGRQSADAATAERVDFPGNGVSFGFSFRVLGCGGPVTLADRAVLVYREFT